MKYIFVALVLCAVLFDIWFSESVPWVVITVIAAFIFYRAVTPFLRI